jgi:serine/threonine protein phosphatase PrpC
VAAVTGASLLVTDRLAAAHGQTADRVATFSLGDSMVLVVADGAGNSASGRLAAEVLVANVRSAVAASTFDVRLPESWAELLSRCDRSLEEANHGGETTAVLVCICAGVVLGASVGDSEAWLQSGSTTTVLTEDQQRKPLLGSGRAAPVSFIQPCRAGTLLVATDGLFKYAPGERVRAALAGQDMEHIADELLQLPRMQSGALPDDVGLVLCRLGSS